jgi:cardiolipin synthase
MASHVVSAHSPQGSESDVWPVEVAGQSFRLFCSTGPLIESMLDDIASAEHRVWIESYIFADDDAGRAVAEALMSRAQAGVDVHFLYDGWGSLRFPHWLLNDLIAAGVHVRAFHPLDEIISHPNFFTLVNRRNHRKLLVIDDNVAYFGGMNIVDTAGVHTVEEARERHLPASAGWRDVHARVVGPMATDIAAVHERLWQRLHRRRVQWPRWPLDKMRNTTGEGAYLFDCLPSKKSRHARRVLCPLLRQARTSITLSMAYFLPMARRASAGHRAWSQRCAARAVGGTSLLRVADEARDRNLRTL